MSALPYFTPAELAAATGDRAAAGLSRPPAYADVGGFVARADCFDLAVWSDAPGRHTWTAYDRNHRVWAWDANVAWTVSDGGREAATAAGLAWLDDRARRLGCEVEMFEARPAVLDHGPAVDPNGDVLQRAMVALRLASPKRADAGRPIVDQADAGHLPIFIAADEPRRF